MDDKKTASNSDNSNAPGTWPKQENSDVSANITLSPQPSGNMVSNDPRAPYAADPMNGGIPTESAVVEADGSEPDSITEVEIGGTGTLIVSGILSQADYNPDLTGWKRIEIYDQMRKGDATVRLGLAAIKTPLVSAGWYIKPGKDGNEDDQYVKFIDEELFHNPNFSFTQFLRQALMMCDYGSAFFEKVWRKRVDGKTGWKKFAQRLPKTIWRYTLQDGITPGITQVLPTGGGNIEIPQWKLLSFINELEGSNYEGISLLRAAYKHWYYKETYYKIDAIASERQGMGVPIINVPPQANPKDKAKAKEVARNMRVNERAYIDLPIGFSISYLDTHAKELKEVKEMVMHHDRQILKAFLAHFLDMGSGASKGTASLSDDQSELFLVSLKYIAKLFSEQMNFAIKELIDMNFTGLKPTEYPTLEVGGIGQVDFALLAQSMQQFVAAGIIIPDMQLEKYIRQTMDLPEAMEADKTDPEDQTKRKVGFPPMNPLMGGDPTDPKAPDQGSAPGKGKPPVSGVPGKKPPTGKSFAENLLTMQEEIQAVIGQREYGN